MSTALLQVLNYLSICPIEREKLEIICCEHAV